MEAITVGLDETMDKDMISQGPQFIAYMVDELQKKSISIITPAEGLGYHINAMEFLSHIPQEQYPAGALAAALYIAGGIRGMERGTISEQRDPEDNEVLANMELLRLALPRRVFTLSQVKYAIDRICWLYENRYLVEGLRFVEEPKTWRFFFRKFNPSSIFLNTILPVPLKARATLLLSAGKGVTRATRSKAKSPQFPHNAS